MTKKQIMLVVQTFIPRTLEAEMDLSVWGFPGVQSEFQDSRAAQRNPV